MHQTRKEIADGRVRGRRAMTCVDAAALFDLGCYGHAHDEPSGAASAYLPNGTSWAGPGASVLMFDHPTRSHVAQSAPVCLYRYRCTHFIV